MPCTFSSVLNPPLGLVNKIAGLTPENPFYTPEYLEVRKRLGAEGCALALDSNDGLVRGCLAFLTRGKLNSRLEITSLPVLEDQEIFWDGVFRFCREQNISVVSAYTFASAEAAITFAEKRTSHKMRSEYRLDLTQPDLWKVMNRRSHRLIKTARSAGLTIRRSNDHNAREIHVSLANLSLDRRRGHGNSIDYSIEMEDVNAFINCGAGELVQVIRGDEVHATMLIARSRTGAYAQSSGTSTDGREMGASHFLFYETACFLKAESVTVFNLGGADEHSKGLQEFKLGLGSKRIQLESAEFFTGGALKRIVTGAVSLVKGGAMPI
ncbi:MAG: GNAT family N-acetyltransferase [Acidobacteria bacterium]|nr:GNAT family N-acetyltransferase [Acidobacteriota bacterium]